MKKEIIVIILSLLATVLVIFLLILPGLDTLDFSRLELNAKKEQLAVAESRSQKISDLAEKYKDNPEALEKINKALPQGQDLAKLLINFENLAAANGLVMHSVDFKPVENKSAAASAKTKQDEVDALLERTKDDAGQASEGEAVPLFLQYKTIKATLSLEGGYDNFKKYLKAIENNARLMDVNSFSYSGRAGQGATLFTFNLSLDMYYQ